MTEGAPGIRSGHPPSAAGRAVTGADLEVAGAPGAMTLGAWRLRIPAGLDAAFASDPACAPEVEGFVHGSPDRCLYHTRWYADFVRAQDGVAELVLLARSGRPLVALPMYAHGRSFFSTRYSGILFPDTDSEATLRMSATGLKEFLGANPWLGYECLQSAQSPFYENPPRCAMIDSLLAGPGIAKRELFTRILRLTPNGREPLPVSGTLTVADLDDDLIGGYEGKKRSEIRQALRSGVQIGYDLLCGEADGARTRAAYERYLPIHATSWLRTGMRPHSAEYWHALSASVQRAGGRDLVVVALAPDGTPVAGVTCHLFEGRALYWSGGSLEEGRALKANSLCLHAAISLCRRDGTAVFEVGRFDPAEPSRKERAIGAYKAQFRGSVVRLVNFVRTPTSAAYRLRATAVRVVRAMRRAAVRDA